VRVFDIILYFQSSIKPYMNIFLIHFIIVSVNILFSHFLIQKSRKPMLKLHLLSLLPMFYFHSYLCMVSHLLWPLHFEGKVLDLFYTIHMVLSPRIYVYVPRKKIVPVMHDFHCGYQMWTIFSQCHVKVRRERLEKERIPCIIHCFWDTPLT
jgi:hypothetical protein